MDAAGSAVGIASLGIQICQGLLSYYDAWKAYQTDISTAYASISDLVSTFKLLIESLGANKLDASRRQRVKECLDLCITGLSALQKKLQKIQKFSMRDPVGLREKTLAEIQRLKYPFQSKTLTKLCNIVRDLHEQLSLALQVLQVDLGVSSHKVLLHVEANTDAIIPRVAAIQNSVDEITRQQQSDQFRKLIDWLSPPDPWTNHSTARQRHEPGTGSWLLQSTIYQQWKTQDTKVLWLSGKPGCGKTVLLSSVVEDVILHGKTTANVGCIFFYFSFSDTQKQTYQNLIRSLVAQLAWKEPLLSLLQKAFDKRYSKIPDTEYFEKWFLCAIEQFDAVFLLLDALDECSENEDGRQCVIDCLLRFSRATSKLKMLITSRELQDIKIGMEELQAQFVPILSEHVDSDIGQYVSNELARDPKLRRLDPTLKVLIQETFAQKADGMFRWAYCQLQELKKLKSMKPKYVKDALFGLPATLDATYERMLMSIEERYRAEVLILLRWLAFELRPLTLEELAEASIIDPDGEGDGIVDVENRCELEDVLHILGDFVVIVEPRNFRKHNTRDKADHRVRLAHYSVKEFLISSRILQGNAKQFFLKESEEHRFLSRSCLTYLMFYSDSRSKKSRLQDHKAFPLLRYAAALWCEHSSRQSPTEVSREVRLLCSDRYRRDWAFVPRLELLGSPNLEFVGSALYYASDVGLLPVVQMLIDRGMDPNADMGFPGNSLLAASSKGFDTIVQELIYGGANVNMPIANNHLGHSSMEYSSALFEAIEQGRESVVKTLIENGADVNMEVGKTRIDGTRVNIASPLQAASSNGQEKIVEMLIKAEANVNASGRLYGSALYIASRRGFEKVVQLLINGGADVNSRSKRGETALQGASRRGFEGVVQILINSGADVNAIEDELVERKNELSDSESIGARDSDVEFDWVDGLCPPLQAASYGGYVVLVKILLAGGADVNEQGGMFGNALTAASFKGYDRIVQILIDHGANVNGEGGTFGNALNAASSDRTAQILIDNGAELRVCVESFDLAGFMDDAGSMDDGAIHDDFPIVDWTEAE